MNATGGELQSLRDSLSRLQSQNRWLTGATAVIGLAFVLNLVAPTQTVRAARFRLYADGQQRGMWRATDQDPALILQDRYGRWRARMSVSIDGPTIGLYQDNGDSGVILSSAPDAASILLHDAHGRPRIRLVVDAGDPRLDFLDEDGALVTSFPKRSGPRSRTRPEQRSQLP